MSVILTATKKSIHTKSSKPKKPKNHAASQQSKFDPTPPMSTNSTTVWHWELDHRPTTIMFDKGTYEVWCNGTELNTQTAFAEGEGGVIDFVLEVKSGVMHCAQIQRHSTRNTKDGMVYQLYVDGISILEHTSKQPCLPTPDSIGMGDVAAPPAYYEDPDRKIPADQKKTK